MSPHLISLNSPDLLQARTFQLKAALPGECQKYTRSRTLGPELLVHVNELLVDEHANNQIKASVLGPD